VETITKTIPQLALRALEIQINRLNKRAEKLCLLPITFATSNHRTITRTVTVEGGFDKTEALDICDVTVSGDIPCIEGYNIIATTDVTEYGNLLYVVQGEELPKKYRDRVECDHCQTKRNRKYTVILRNTETREYIQVGHSCLKDFFPFVSNAEALINYATSILSSLFTAGDDDEDKLWSYGGGEYAMALEHFLAATLVCIREWGWVSGRVAYEENRRSTKDMVSNLISSLPQYRDDEDNRMLDLIGSQPDRDTIDFMLAFYDDHMAEKSDKSDYEHNIYVLRQLGYITWKNYGFTASMIPFIQREQEREIARREAAALPLSTHTGTVGKREVFKGLKVLTAKYIETQYGCSILYIFRDDAGHIFKWFCSGTLVHESGRNAEPGDIYNLKATVKSHDEYNGQKQTVINRAVIA
jgi:hypothetical protein